MILTPENPEMSQDEPEINFLIIPETELSPSSMNFPNTGRRFLHCKGRAIVSESYQKITMKRTITFTALKKAQSPQQMNI
jgi:hypothetical protein